MSNTSPLQGYRTHHNDEIEKAEQDEDISGDDKGVASIKHINN